MQYNLIKKSRTRAELEISSGMISIRECCLQRKRNELFVRFVAERSSEVPPWTKNDPVTFHRLLGRNKSHALLTFQASPTEYFEHRYHATLPFFSRFLAGLTAFRLDRPAATPPDRGTASCSPRSALFTPHSDNRGDEVPPDREVD